MPFTELKEVETTIERRSSRTDIAFDCLYRIYKDNDKIEAEMFDQNEHFARTFYYQGDFSEEINEAFNHYFDDTLELIDLLLECDPEFRIHDHFDEEGEFYISMLGFFKEELYTEGSYEEGYYDCLALAPTIVSYELVKKEDAIKEFMP